MSCVLIGSLLVLDPPLLAALVNRFDSNRAQVQACMYTDLGSRSCGRCTWIEQSRADFQNFPRPEGPRLGSPCPIEVAPVTTSSIRVM